MSVRLLPRFGGHWTRISACLGRVGRLSEMAMIQKPRCCASLRDGSPCQGAASKAGGPLRTPRRGREGGGARLAGAWQPPCRRLRWGAGPARAGRGHGR